MIMTTTQEKPFSQACENNKEAIGAVLARPALYPQVTPQRVAKGSAARRLFEGIVGLCRKQATPRMAPWRIARREPPNLPPAALPLLKREPLFPANGALPRTNWGALRGDLWVKGRPRLRHCQHLLEIGSGTGQHAVYLAPRLPHLVWQTSDLPENHPGIHQWLQDFPSDNLRLPLSLDVTQTEWPLTHTDAVFTANTFHIMAWEQVLALLDGCGAILSAGGLLLVYGPFNEQGEYTSESNARFDQWLKETAPHRAIRDRQQTAAEAKRRGLELRETLEMPANNRILVFERV